MVHTRLPALEAAPIVSSEESNAGNSGGARSHAILGIGGGHATQGEDGYALCSYTGQAKSFEALGQGCARNLLEDGREED